MNRLIHSSMALVTALSLYTTADLIAQPIDAFMVRAPLEPYKIHQLPGFLMHSRERSDFIMQLAKFQPGVGGWHIHPGPSFAYVVQGYIMLQKFNEKDGCFETPVYGPGEVYIKPANELHRAIVLGADEEVELIVRFNYPEGSPIGIPVPDPGCDLPSDILLAEALSAKRSTDHAVALAEILSKDDTTPWPAEGKLVDNAHIGALLAMVFSPDANPNLTPRKVDSRADLVRP